MTSEALSWIEPDWPAPPWVRAVTTTRQGGFSAAPFNGLNLAEHVGDDHAAVMKNRDLLRKFLNLPCEPRWLTQVHGRSVIEVGVKPGPLEADASIARGPGRICAVLTADCLPLLLCDREGTQVAAIHAGWRGLAAGVIEATLRNFSGPAKEILAWMGPAIGPQSFEVGAEVREAFIKHDPSLVDVFIPNHSQRWMADIYQLARQRLESHGINYLGGGDCCTVADAGRFYSYRRDGRTGRMASLIWIEE